MQHPDRYIRSPYDLKGYSHSFRPLLAGIPIFTRYLFTVRRAVWIPWRSNASQMAWSLRGCRLSSPLDGLSDQLLEPFLRHGASRLEKPIRLPGNCLQKNSPHLHPTALCWRARLTVEMASPSLLPDPPISGAVCVPVPAGKKVPDGSPEPGTPAAGSAAVPEAAAAAALLFPAVPSDRISPVHWPVFSPVQVFLVQHELAAPGIVYRKSKPFGTGFHPYILR